MTAAVSEVESLVQETNAVPKQTVFPLFHRIGQLFEVQHLKRLLGLHSRKQHAVVNLVPTRLAGNPG